MLHQINICKNDYETAFLKNLKLSFTDSGVLQIQDMEFPMEKMLMYG